jgi:hypothetical protein
MMSVIPAVEVEPPGCSFNPPLAAHQVCVILCSLTFQMCAISSIL